MLTEKRKERKNRHTKLNKVDKGDLYILKINCKGKRTVGKANKGINVEKIIIGLKIRKKEKKRKSLQNCKSPMQRQVITTINNVTEEKKKEKKFKSLIRLNGGNKIDNYNRVGWGQGKKGKKFKRIYRTSQNIGIVSVFLE